MSTITVSTKDEFEKAVKNNAEKIIVKGALAQEIIKAQKKKDIGKKVGFGGAIAAGAAAAVGMALAPVTAGASAVAGFATASAATATIAGLGTVTLSAAEFMALCGTVLGTLGIAASVINTVAKNYDVKINAGSTTVECTRK